MVHEKLLLGLACTALVISALHNVTLFLRNPRRYCSIFDPTLDAVTLFDRHKRMTVWGRIYMFVSWLGISLSIGITIDTIVSLISENTKLEDTFGAIAVSAGIISFALLYGMEVAGRREVKATFRIEKLERYADRLEQEHDSRMSIIALNRDEKTELERLRLTSAADKQTIAQLENTIANLQKQIPVTIRFEG